jgi:hypothetical protein
MPLLQLESTVGAAAERCGCREGWSTEDGLRIDGGGATTDKDPVHQLRMLLVLPLRLVASSCVLPPAEPPRDFRDLLRQKFVAGSQNGGISFTKTVIKRGLST